MGQNEVAVRDAYARYSKGDFVTRLDIFADDIVWKSSGAPNRIATAGEWKGLKGVREYFAALFREWHFHAFELIDLIVNDDRRFVARIALELKHARTGAMVRFEKVDLLTMERGKCTSFSEIFDAAPLERAARL
jgi:ketosteroid isomerase-like protein